MGEQSSDERRLLSNVPKDGRTIGNMALRAALGWSDERYLRVRDALVARGTLARGVGRGGTVRLVSGDDEKLLARVPRDGSPIGNMRLQRELGWSEEAYWATRDRLIERGILAPGRGRGGTVRRLQEDIPPPSEGTESVDLFRLEADLYEPLAKVLSEEFKRDLRLEDFHVEITANQGARATGGKWSRPDITAVSLQRYALVPERVFDVRTFEVKPSTRWDLTSIHEASAHARFATRPCALCLRRSEIDPPRRSETDPPSSSFSYALRLPFGKEGAAPASGLASVSLSPFPRFRIR